MKEDTPIFKSTISIEKRNSKEVEGNDNIELKISKQDDFGNEYFIKENINIDNLKQEISWRQDEINRLTEIVNQLQEKLNLIK